MLDQNIGNDDADNHLGTGIELDRRRMMRRAGIGLGAAAMAATGLVGNSTPAQATNQGNGPADLDILNFALNLEYLEAEFYLYAATGQGLAANQRTGTGSQVYVNPGQPVQFKSSAIAQYAQRIAVDEQSHVRFLRSVLGSYAVAEPLIDIGIGPGNAFSTLAVAAGLISPGQTFNPYGDDLSFLLAASIFEDVGVTAYLGAARFIGNPDYLEAAAGILAVEAYHSGALRSLLANMGAGQAFGLISNLRGTLSAASGGSTAESTLLAPNNAYNFVPNDSNGLAFKRSTRQVLNIVYGAGNASRGLFFPNGINGVIVS